MVLVWQMGTVIHADHSLRMGRPIIPGLASRGYERVRQNLVAH